MVFVDWCVCVELCSLFVVCVCELCVVCVFVCCLLCRSLFVCWFVRLCVCLLLLLLVVGAVACRCC